MIFGATSIASIVLCHWIALMLASASLLPLLWCFQSTLLGVPASALYNPNRESRTIWASKLLQSPFLAQDCVHFVWCMPSEMANGLRVTSTLQKKQFCKEAEKTPLLALAGVELPPQRRRLVPMNH